jgi:hypothetical protein
LTACRSVVGVTSVLGVAANDERPRLMPAGSWSANAEAAVWATWSREGSTSVARIESDTSIVSITVARLRGTCATPWGPASAIVMSTSAASTRAMGTWRHRPGPRGATRSSSARLVKRIV